MAAAFLLLLPLLLGAAQATAPPPCQGDPSSWCWDTAMATRCGWEQQCQRLQDRGNVADRNDVAGGDSVADGDIVADEDIVADGDGVADEDIVADGDSVADGDGVADEDIVADGDGVADEDIVADGDGVANDSMAEGKDVAQRKGFKCSLCTKALKKIQALAGDNPDEAGVTAALQKGCRALGRLAGRMCQRLVNKYRAQISEGLQNGDLPRDICTAVGICRS